MKIYTAITFAPVQGFIEKSRKLRDLYGSSFILSYLSTVICKEAEQEGCYVVSPAIINITQGTPNQIIIAGDFPREKAEEVFNQAWKTIVIYFRKSLEKKLPDFNYSWSRSWEAWANYTWEFFHAQSNSEEVRESNKNLAPADKLTIITHLRRKLNQNKLSRNWIGINWQGESSTLSGADAIAYPEMGAESNSDIANQSRKIERFYQHLSQTIGEKIIDANEYLSIPELVKRLITLPNQISGLNQQLKVKIETPPKFNELNRQDQNRWTAWFQGDGDSIGEYLRKLRSEITDNELQTLEEITGNEAKKLQEFSEKMLNWGAKLQGTLPIGVTAQGRIIYAGGDDFLGVFYPNGDSTESNLQPQEVLDWFYKFIPKVWKNHQVHITVSVGLVWAGHSTPQRDVLQHCREAEKLAKKSGKNRLAIRILFNSGNYLDWVCPWCLLESVLTGYRDRQGDQNWTDFYSDINILRSRHGFSDRSSDLALGLFEIYFGQDNCQKLKKTLQNDLINDWIISLAEVGFHLFTSLVPDTPLKTEK